MQANMEVMLIRWSSFEQVVYGWTHDGGVVNLDIIRSTIIDGKMEVPLCQSQLLVTIQALGQVDK